MINRPTCLARKLGSCGQIMNHGGSHGSFQPHSSLHKSPRHHLEIKMKMKLYEKESALGAYWLQSSSSAIISSRLF